jgi:N-acetylmuramoyl-L-alanine amidase
MGPSEAAAAPSVIGVRTGEQLSATRLVLDLSESVEYRVFFLADPYRVIVDFPTMEWRTESGANVSGGLINAIRFGSFDSRTSRLVVEVRRPVKVDRSFLLPPNGRFPHRFVLDVSESSREEFLRALSAPPQASRGSSQAEPAAPVASLPGPNRPRSSAAEPPSRPRQPSTERPRDARRIVVLDPGHGGIDPGAVGGNGQFEKDLTLQVGRRLKQRLDASGRYRALLTREGDQFVRLRDRVEFARKNKAELFISLHADSMSDPRIRGASVYTLSEKASDKEAESLAQRENAADLIAGVDLAGESDDVRSILIDLAQRETMNLSATFAGLVIPEFQRNGKTLPKGHRFAGFAVLRAPDVPSVLVEMGYLSNPLDERQLWSSEYQGRLVDALTRSIDGYFAGLAKR